MALGYALKGESERSRTKYSDFGPIFNSSGPRLLWVMHRPRPSSYLQLQFLGVIKPDRPKLREYFGGRKSLRHFPLQRLYVPWAGVSTPWTSQPAQQIASNEDNYKPMCSNGYSACCKPWSTDISDFLRASLGSVMGNGQSVAGYLPGLQIDPQNSMLTMSSQILTRSWEHVSKLFPSRAEHYRLQSALRTWKPTHAVQAISIHSAAEAVKSFRGRT